jgi:hypothetical protein
MSEDGIIRLGRICSEYLGLVSLMYSRGWSSVVLTCAISGPQWWMVSSPSPIRPRGCITSRPKMLMASSRYPTAISPTSFLCMIINYTAAVRDSQINLQETIWGQLPYQTSFEPFSIDVDLEILNPGNLHRFSESSVRFHELRISNIIFALLGLFGMFSS